MASWRTRLAVMLVLLVIVVAALVYQEAGRRKRSGRGPLATASAKPASGGNQDAPVKVVAFYPLNEGHKFIADYLLKFAAQNPNQVHVQVYDMQTPDGMKKWQKSGLTCAGVLVNGKTKHEIKRGDKTETVDLVKRMGVAWQEEDFEALVKQLSSAKGN